jgi:hypothetical protein
MYVANYFSGTISQIRLSDGSVTKLNWTTGLNEPFDLVVNNNNIYVSNFLSNNISEINLSNGNISNFNWKTGLSSPMGLALYNSTLYIANLDSGSISKKTVTNVPVANICFLGNTPILTDQGTVVISKINPNKHTINGRDIVDITKTITEDEYLVCFDKNSLGINYPSQKTNISKRHKVYYKGKMIEAYKFIGHFKNVYKTKYNGETLYNVLMKQHYTMRVNNLICETLHPNNIVAKLHTSKSTYDNDVKNVTIMLLEEYVKHNDLNSYNKLIKHC